MDTLLEPEMEDLTRSLQVNLKENVFRFQVGWKMDLLLKTDFRGVKQYDFKYYDKDGYEVTMGGLSRTFNPEFWNYAKMISALLRHEIPIENVVNIIGGLNFREETINSWRRGVVRALQSFIADGTKQKGKTCPSCGMESIYFQEGCLTCSSCGYSKCG